MKFSSINRVLLNILIIIVITFILLEIIIRLFISNGAIDFLGKKIMILPLPLVSQQQIKALDDFKKDSSSYIQFDATLGWSIRPNVHREQEGVQYTSNKIGVRALREYDLIAPPGITRIAAFGPSFTHGDEVNDSDTWEAQMERFNPSTEVMNWGVGAYGTDQAFLRYQQEGKRYQPKIVLIGYEEENLNRNINRFHPFYYPQGLPMTKPMYIPQEESLVLLENPFKTVDDFYQSVLNTPNDFLTNICPVDFFCDEKRFRHQPLDKLATFRFFRTLFSAFEAHSTIKKLPQNLSPEAITIRLLKLFTKEVVDHHGIPLVIFFPMHLETMENYEKGLPTPYHALLKQFQIESSALVVDLSPSFVEAKQMKHINYEAFFSQPSGKGHYSPLGNEVVAQAILQKLSSTNLLTIRY